MNAKSQGKLVPVAVLLALCCAGCLPPTKPKTVPTETGRRTPAAPTVVPAATLVPSDYSELLGFPAHPAATTLTLAQLQKALGLKYQFLIDDLTRHHATAGKTADDVRVRLLESYSRAYPIYLQTDPADGGRSKVYLPTADGAFATETGGARECDDKSFVCETLSTPNTPGTPYDVTIVVGWSVELGSNVSTGGQSLVVLADRFASSGYTLDTILPPVGYPALLTDPARQRRDPTYGFPYDKAGSGNDGKGSGSLFLLVSTLESLHADTTGQHGQDGADSTPGLPVTVARCGLSGCSYYQVCSFEGKEDSSGTPITHGPRPMDRLTDGGDGGKGGQAGNAFVRFATLLGVGEAPKTDAECFATANACATAACGWNPSNTVCDHLREADDPTCSDKVDNDADHQTDCDQESCWANPHVARCEKKEKRPDGHGGQVVVTVGPAPQPIEGDVYVSWVACSGWVYRPECNGPARPDKYIAAPQLSLGPGVNESVSTQLSFKLSVGDSGQLGKGPLGDNCAFRSGSWPSPDANHARLDIKSWSRREVDVLRALLSPRQWRVGTAQANSRFKKTKLGDAALLYLLNIRRMEGALEEEGTDCATRTLPADVDPGPAPGPYVAPAGCYGGDVQPAYCQKADDDYQAKVKEYEGKVAASAVAKDARQRVTTLLDVVCPELLVDRTKLGYLMSGRNYFGLGTNPAVNPRSRYSDFPLSGGGTIGGLRTQFNDLTAALRSQGSLAVALSTATDVKQLLSQNKDALENAMHETSTEVGIAEKRLAAAKIAEQGAKAALENRLTAIAGLDIDLKFSDRRLQAQYEADDVKGHWFVKLTKAVAKYIGGKIGEELEVDGAGNALEQLFGVAWDTVVDKIRNAPVRKGTVPGGDLADMIDGTLDGKYDMKRDEVAEQVVRKVVAVEQQKLIIEVLDLAIAREKAAVELQVASDSLDLARLRAANANRLAEKAEQYDGFSAPLSPLDVNIALHQAYATSTSLVEGLTLRYYELLRAADYQFLPYRSVDGASLLDPLVNGDTDFDFNITNYENMLRKLADVVDKELATGFSGSTKAYYRRINAPVFEKDVYNDKLAAIGLTGVVDDPRVLALPVRQGDLDGDPALLNQRKMRLQQVRVNLISATGTAVQLPVVYVARDTSDSFLVGRAGGKDLLAGFEAIPRDLYPDGSVKSALHYQSLAACFSAPPGCTLADPACVTTFERDTLGATCAISGGASPSPANNTFYGRSLVGDWLVVAPGAQLSKITDLAAVEVMFYVGAEDL